MVRKEEAPDKCVVGHGWGTFEDPIVPTESPDTCLGERDYWGEFECMHEFAGDMICEDCKYGPYPEEFSYDPRYEIEPQRVRHEEIRSQRGF
jgi:hypothetical protein